MSVHQLFSRFQLPNLLAGAMVVLALVVAQAGAAIAQGATPEASPVAAADCLPEGAEPAPMPTAKLYIEYNATDGDLGVHGFFDTEGYAILCVFNPNGTAIFEADALGPLQELGMGELFSESREPPLSKFGFDELEAMFPAGEYAVSGTRYDGTGFMGTALFTHNVPAPPTIVAPQLGDEENASEAMVDLAEPLVVDWDEVNQTVNGEAAVLTGYQVIVTKEQHNDPHGRSRPIFNVHLPPDQTSITVSTEFLEPETLYEVEVLALEASGNQTISLGFFTTGEQE